MRRQASQHHQGVSGTSHQSTLGIATVKTFGGRAWKEFVRLQQGVELTPEGKEFFDPSQHLLAETEKLEKRFKNGAKANDVAPLIVGGSHNVSVNVLLKLGMAFKERHPSVQVILETDHSPAIERRLLASELLNVPELRQIKTNSFIVSDRRRPLAPMAQEFLEFLREKRNSPVAVDDRIKIGTARRLSVH